MIDVREKTYTFLRMALVALLVSLGVAVIWQTYRQGWQILDSVSAYYYTPAQPIFVGALIGLGACMIALRGGNHARGGVPEPRRHVRRRRGGRPDVAGRGLPDGDRGVPAVREPPAHPAAGRRPGLPHRSGPGAGDPREHRNSLVALLVVGALALAATWFLASRDSSPEGVPAARPSGGATGPASPCSPSPRSCWWRT